MCKLLPGVSFLPFFVFSWYSFMFLLSYGISVAKSHVKFYYTFVSDAGLFPPESFIFAETVNLGAFVAIGFFYARYRHLREICDLRNLGNNLRRFSQASYYIGIIAALSSTVVGNVSEVEDLTLHGIGALVCFIGGFLWMIVQVYMSFKLYPIIGNCYVNWIRVFLLAVCMIAFPICTAATFSAFDEYDGSNIHRWNPEDGGYISHAIAVATEWLFVFSALIYFLTFYYELRDVILEEPVIKLRTSIDPA